LNQQGTDKGTQYRSAVFYHDEQQRAIVEQLIKDLNESRLWEKPIVTQVVPLDKFYPAEDYHREYFSHHPEQAYCRMVISPKVNKFRKQWAKRLKRSSTK
jgi:peptide-methionine (S)-S-oxide reductase